MTPVQPCSPCHKVLLQQDVKCRQHTAILHEPAQCLRFSYRQILVVTPKALPLLQMLGDCCRDSDWGSHSFHALQQIAVSLAPEHVHKARLVNKHWRTACDRAIEQLSPSHTASTDQLQLIASSFPSVRHLKLGRVNSEAITSKVISGLKSLSQLQLISLPQQLLLPHWIHQLSTLHANVELALTDTSLTLEFTEAMPSLRNLAHLQLSYCTELSKGLPFFTALTNLQSLNIQAGYLHTDPEQGHYLLQTLRLDFPVDDPIQAESLTVLSSLAQLTSLRLIGVAGDLSFPVAAQLTSFRKLQHLAIYVAQATGVAQLAVLASLTYLCIKSNAIQVTDDMISSLSQLQQLKSLVLEGSPIPDSREAKQKQMLHNGVDGLLGLPHLGTLQFWGWLDSQAVAHVSGLTRLTRLTLWECGGLTVQTLPCIATLKHLVHLDLSYQKLAGAEWNPVGELTRLTALHLHGCRQVTDETVRGLSTLTNLRTFDISHGVMKRSFYKDCLSVEGIRLVGLITSLRDLNLTDLTNINDKAVEGLHTLANLTQICLVGAHSLLHPAQNTGLLALTNLLSLDLSRSAHIDIMQRTDFQPLFAKLKKLRQLRYGADNFAYTLASEEPEAVEVYPSDQGKYAKLHCH